MSRLSFSRSSTAKINNNSTVIESFIETVVARKRNELQQMFNIYDREQKGYIRTEDLYNSLLECGLQINERIKKIVTSIDNNSGKIDLTGFTRLMTGKVNTVQKALNNNLASTLIFSTIK